MQNTCSYRDRQSQAKGKSQGQMAAHSQLQRQDCSNELSATPPQKLSIDTEGGHEFSEAEFPVLGNGKTGSSGSPPLSTCLLRWKTSHGNNDSWPHDELKPWPIYPEPWDQTISETSNPLEQGTSHLQDLSPVIELPASLSPKQVEENNPERSE